MSQEELTDRDLVNKVLDGNTLMFRTIIANSQGLVIQIIYKMIRNPEDRKDLAQEVYLKVYDKLNGFRFNSKLSTWIATITYNTCLNFLEKKKLPIQDVTEKEARAQWEIRDYNIVGNVSNQTELYIFRKDRSKVLALEIDKLAPLYKVLITLFHYEELTYKEIGKITDLPEGTIKNYLYRARRQLRDSLILNYKKEDL